MTRTYSGFQALNLPSSIANWYVPWVIISLEKPEYQTRILVLDGASRVWVVYICLAGLS